MSTTSILKAQKLKTSHLISTETLEPLSLLKNCHYFLSSVECRVREESEKSFFSFSFLTKSETPIDLIVDFALNKYQCCDEE